MVTKIEPKVHFNIETAENEDQPETFRAALGSRVVEMLNPRDLSVEEFESLDQANPLSFLSLCVPDEEDRAAMRKLKARQLDALLTSFFQHYGIDRGKSAGRLF